MWMLLKKRLMAFSKSLLKLLSAPGTVKSKFPTEVADDDYAVIKLRNFDNLQVLIMVDKKNGGLAISYEDKHLDEAEKALVKDQIASIISNEMEKQDGDI